MTRSTFRPGRILALAILSGIAGVTMAACTGSGSPAPAITTVTDVGPCKAVVPATAPVRGLKDATGTVPNGESHIQYKLCQAGFDVKNVFFVDSVLSYRASVRFPGCGDYVTYGVVQIGTKDAYGFAIDRAKKGVKVGAGFLIEDGYMVLTRPLDPDQAKQYTLCNEG